MPTNKSPVKEGAMKQLSIEKPGENSTIERITRNGVPLLRRKGGEVVTEEMIDRIREKEGV